MIGVLFLLEKLILNGIFIYRIVIFLSIIMSWVPAMRQNAFGQMIEKVSEPYLSFFRKFIPPIGMIDFSPIIALIALNFIALGVGNVFAIIYQMFL